MKKVAEKVATMLEKWRESKMFDGHGRQIHYLRISVTDRCNLRCRYCMPEEGIEALQHEDMLTYDEIQRVVKIMAKLGVNRIRLTGGEPLVRKDMDVLVRGLKAIEGIDSLFMTTNGILLEEMGLKLVEAGVDGLNISLDTLDPERFYQLTRRNQFQAVWQGLQKVCTLPYQSIKINCVLSPEGHLEDWLEVAQLAQDYPIDVRFIEWMPIAGEAHREAISSHKMLEALSHRFGRMLCEGTRKNNGPAEYWQIEGFQGKIGFIHAMSHQFCESCNRIRLTATGDLKLCLFYDVGIALRPMLRDGSTDEKIEKAILAAIQHKPQKHMGKIENIESQTFKKCISHSNGMYAIGG